MAKDLGKEEFPAVIEISTGYSWKFLVKKRPWKPAEVLFL